MTMPLRDHPYHELSNLVLRSIIGDAAKAARAMRGVDEKAECKYLDQVNDACTILYWRKQRDEADRAR